MSIISKDGANSFLSPYNFGLNVTTFDKDRVGEFFHYLLTTFVQDLHLNINFLEELDHNLLFTDLEFNKPVPDDSDLSFINKYLYPIIFSNIRKNEQSRIEFKTKYVFTLDRSLTKFSSKSGIRYGEIVLGKKPILYYLHVDSQSLIDFIKYK